MKPTPSLPKRKGGRRATDLKEQGGTLMSKLKHMKHEDTGKYMKVEGTHRQKGFHVFNYIPITWGIFLNFQVSIQLKNYADNGIS